jgi:hypothetical protein
MNGLLFFKNETPADLKAASDELAGIEHLMRTLRRLSDNPWTDPAPELTQMCMKAAQLRMGYLTVYIAEHAQKN